MFFLQYLNWRKTVKLRARIGQYQSHLFSRPCVAVGGFGCWAMWRVVPLYSLAGWANSVLGPEWVMGEVRQGLSIVFVRANSFCLMGEVGSPRTWGLGRVFVAMVANYHGTFQKIFSRLVCPGLRRSGSRAACPVVDSAASISQDDRPSAFLQALFRPRVCFAKFMSHFCPKASVPLETNVNYLVWFNTIFSFSCIITKPCRPNFDLFGGWRAL